MSHDAWNSIIATNVIFVRALFISGPFCMLCRHNLGSHGFFFASILLWRTSNCDRRRLGGKSKCLRFIIHNENGCPNVLTQCRASYKFCRCSSLEKPNTCKSEGLARNQINWNLIENALAHSHQRKIDTVGHMPHPLFLRKGTKLVSNHVWSEPTM